METINVTQETKNEFERDRFNLRMKESKIISQEEFIQMLIKLWREQTDLPEPTQLGVED